MTADLGHNSAAGAQILQIIERVEHVEAERAALAEGVKEIFAEAKGNGLDVRVLKKIIALRKQPREKLSEEQELLKLYLENINQLDLLFA